MKMNRFMTRLACLGLAALLLASCAGLPEPSGNGFRLRVAVIPLRNASNVPDAGSIDTYLLIHELARSDIFEPVEPGHVREILINERTVAQEVGPPVLRALRDELGVDLVIMGVVEAHQEEKGQGVARSSMAATLMATWKATLVWAGESQVSGNDTGFVFRLGRLRTADQVARRAAADLVRQMEEVAIARKDQIIDEKISRAARR